MPPGGLWDPFGRRSVAAARTRDAVVHSTGPRCKACTERGARNFRELARPVVNPDRKSTRLNSSHGYISYAVFCLKKKKKHTKKKRRQMHRPRQIYSTHNN